MKKMVEGSRVHGPKRKVRVVVPAAAIVSVDDGYFSNRRIGVEPPTICTRE